MTRRRRNEGNGWMPRVGRLDGVADCNRCGTPILWVKLAHARIPYEWSMGLSFHDHRWTCAMRAREIEQAANGQHRVTPVRRRSRSLVSALGSSWSRTQARKARKARSSRDEFVAHVSATQAAGQTTGRAGALATASPSYNPEQVAAEDAVDELAKRDRRFAP